MCVDNHHGHGLEQAAATLSHSSQGVIRMGWTSKLLGSAKSLVLFPGNCPTICNEGRAGSWFSSPPGMGRVISPFEVVLLSPVLIATPFASGDPLERKPAAWQAPPLPSCLLLPPPKKNNPNPFRPTSLGKQPNNDNGGLKTN